MADRYRNLGDFHKGFYEFEPKLPEASELAEKIREYHLVLQHTIDSVQVIDAKQYQEVPEDLLELRAFDDLGELHVVRMDDGFLGRIVRDGTGERVVTLDEEHLLWGTSASHSDGMWTLEEDRGARVSIPASAIPDMSPDDVVTMRVRNYLDEGQVDAESGDTSFSFIDYRLVALKVRKAN